MIFFTVSVFWEFCFCSIFVPEKIECSQFHFSIAIEITLVANFIPRAVYLKHKLREGGQHYLLPTEILIIIQLFISLQLCWEDETTRKPLSPTVHKFFAPNYEVNKISVSEFSSAQVTVEPCLSYHVLI